MRKKLIYLIATLLISFSAIAQEKEICLPESVVSKVINDLIVKDHLVYKVSLQDSIIRVYQHKDSLSTVEVQKYKLGEEQYKIMVESLKQQLKIVEAQNKDLTKEKNKLKIKNTVTQTLSAVALAVLLWFNLKD